LSEKHSIYVCATIPRHSRCLILSILWREVKQDLFWGSMPLYILLFQHTNNAH
jgi:hypothetical protein